jgi:hypothetical protein
MQADRPRSARATNHDQRRCTATVPMPISLQVQMIRQAIPTIGDQDFAEASRPFITLPICNCHLAIYSFHQRHGLNRQSASEI